MENFFNEDDKKILNACINYMRSQSMRRGEIEIYQGDDYFSYTYDPSDEYASHFTNKWSVEVPAFFVPIIKKVMNVAAENYENFDLDVDGTMNSHSIELVIDAQTREITVELNGYYYSTSETDGVYWENDDNDLENIINEIKEVTGDEFVSLRYDGGGDSGYIDGTFENGDNVPATVEDWCYTQLENNFGGWEINEGSYGIFEFNMVDKVCNLSHTYRTDESFHETLFEVKF